MQDKLGINKNFAFKLIRSDGFYPAIRIGARRVIIENDLNKWINENQHIFNHKKERDEKITNAANNLKKCSMCHNVLDVSEFSRDSKPTDRLHGYCKKCACIRIAKYRASKRKAELQKWIEEQMEIESN
jgi:hypothetical protein